MSFTPSEPSEEKGRPIKIGGATILNIDVINKTPSILENMTTRDIGPFLEHHVDKLDRTAQTALVDIFSGDTEIMMLMINEHLHKFHNPAQQVFFKDFDTLHGGAKIDKLTALAENSEYLKPSCQDLLVTFVKDHSHLKSILAQPGKLGLTATEAFVRDFESFYMLERNIKESIEPPYNLHEQEWPQYYMIIQKARNHHQGALEDIHRARTLASFEEAGVEGAAPI